MHKNANYNIVQAKANADEWVVVFGQRLPSGHAAPGAQVKTVAMPRAQAIEKADRMQANYDSTDPDAEQYGDDWFRKGSIKHARVSHCGETYNVTYGIAANGTLKGETVIISINGLGSSFFSAQETEHIYNQIGGK